MTLTNIEWTPSTDQVYEILVNGGDDQYAAEVLGMEVYEYRNLSYNDRYDFVKDFIEEFPDVVNEVLELPDSVEVPEGITTEEDITNWLADTYGTFFSHYDIKTDTKGSAA